jgi:3-hydroxybutyryl-CoA dehydrogenase
LEVRECLACRKPLVSYKPKKLIVEYATEVSTPSRGHEEVPYYVLMLKDERGNRFVRKSKQPMKKGDEYCEQTAVSAPKSVIGLVGSGVIGTALVELFLREGYKLVWKSRNKKKLEERWEFVKSRLLRSYDDKGIKLIEKRITLTDKFTDIGRADFIIETVIEDLSAKKRVYEELEKVCREDAVIATNTSSLSINKLAEKMNRPERFVGMHFFNPPTRMRLVEVVWGDKTADEAVRATVDLSKSLKKVPVVVRDSPGFVVNRLFIPYLNDAVVLLDNNVTTKEEIDLAVKLGLNNPLGPFELLDLIGIDVFNEVITNFHDATGEERFKVPESIKRMIREKRLGRKTKRGFYDYGQAT